MSCSISNAHRHSCAADRSEDLKTCKSMQINGGGRVPLSRAKCCRVCLPDELTPSQQQALPADTNITAVISVGCHASTAKSKVSCEADPTTTFAAGFQKAILVPSLASATYYPEGPMTCCVPALMLSNGVWPLLFLSAMPSSLCAGSFASTWRSEFLVRRTAHASRKQDSLNLMHRNDSVILCLWTTRIQFIKAVTRLRAHTQYLHAHLAPEWIIAHLSSEA